MSAETLQEAAALMRQHANGATEAREGRPWRASGVNTVGDDLLALYFAAWSPRVALAVADWLDKEAELLVEMDELVVRLSKQGLPADVFTEAVAVAQAYLEAAS